MNSHIHWHSRTTIVLCRCPQPNDRKISREARQAGKRLAGWLSG